MGDTAADFIGRPVCITGLVGRPELNGRVGCIVLKDDETERFCVRVLPEIGSGEPVQKKRDQKKLAVKESNLKDLRGVPGRDDSTSFVLDNKRIMKLHYANEDEYEGYTSTWAQTFIPVAQGGVRDFLDCGIATSINACTGRPTLYKLLLCWIQNTAELPHVEEDVPILKVRITIPPHIKDIRYPNLKSNCINLGC